MDGRIDIGAHEASAEGGGALSSTRADYLFDWAERNVSGVFTPPALSQTSPPFRFRFYPPLALYLAASSQDGHVYTLMGGQLNDLGPATDLIAPTGCS